MKRYLKNFLELSLEDTPFGRYQLKEGAPIDSIESKINSIIESRAQKAKKILTVLQDFNSGESLKDAICLDVGCSIGAISNYFSKKARFVLASDIDKGAIEFANSKFRNGNDSLLFMLSDASNIGAKDNSIDILISNGVFAQLPYQEKHIEEIERVLKEDGICYFSAINKLRIIEPNFRIPFLSWLPKGVADAYIRVTKRGKEYHERPWTCWAMKKMLKKYFIVEDYGAKIIKEPKRYHAIDTVPENGMLTKIPSPILEKMSFLFPLCIFILRKRVSEPVE